MKVVLWALAACALCAQTLSEWAFEGPDHRLHYRPDTHGNTIMDFSSAGYRGGGVRPPSAAVVQRLTAVSGDNTARIQAALDKAMGAVVLASGEYAVEGTLSITRSGVVLRGEKGAAIRLTGKPHCFLEIHGSGTWHEDGAPEPVLDAYVPAGSAAFRVRGAFALHPGDHVLVVRPVTREWLHFLGMDSTVHSDHSQPWIRAGSAIRTDRMVDSVEGDRVILDAPLSDALDSQYGAAYLVRYSFPGRISETGVEGLRIVAPIAVSGEPQYTALRLDAVEDAWARDLEIQDAQTGIVIGPGAKRVTVTNVSSVHSPHSGAGSPVDFSLQGTQILLDRCRVAGEGASPVVTESQAVGPIVLLNFSADQGGVSSHQPWATGLLVDGGKMPGATASAPGVSFSKRVTPQSAEWSVAWSVAWNVTSPFLLVQEPPGAMNWCIGCIGTAVTAGGTPNGIFDSPGKKVDPTSLYLHQLRDRIGPEALQSIGY
jgi:hypothetical protein